MMRMMMVAAMLVLAGCSLWEEKKEAPAAATPAPAVSDTAKVTDQEKRYFIARHAVEKGTNKRWSGFRTIMDLAVAGFEPAREYYLTMRDTKPVLPGESEASFGTYADAVKPILSASSYKLRTEKSKDCSANQNFALIDTKREGGGIERWLFEYCGEKLWVPVQLTLNRETGRIDAAAVSEGITVE